MTTNLSVYTIKPWAGERQTCVVHRNLLMYITPPHRQEGMQSESEDSDYDTLPEDVELSEPAMSTTGAVTLNQTGDHQLAQNIQNAWTKVVQYIQHK